MFVRGLDKVYPGMGLKYIDPNREEIAGAKVGIKKQKWKIFLTLILLVSSGMAGDLVGGGLCEA